MILPAPRCSWRPTPPATSPAARFSWTAAGRRGSRRLPHNSVMTLAEFRATLSSAAPPSNLSPALAALWQDAKGDWAAAHRTAQDITDADGAWIHAYLHRKEG